MLIIGTITHIIDFGSLIVDTLKKNNLYARANSDNLNLNQKVVADDGCDGSGDGDDCEGPGDSNENNDGDDEDWSFWTPLSISLVTLGSVVGVALAGVGVYFSVKAIMRVSQQPHINMENEEAPNVMPIARNADNPRY